VFNTKELEDMQTGRGSQNTNRYPKITVNDYATQQNYKPKIGSSMPITMKNANIKISQEGTHFDF